MPNLSERDRRGVGRERRSGRSAPRWRGGLVAAVAAASLLVVPVAAAAQEAPYDRGISRACSGDARTADPFVDVVAGGTHAGAISCLWVYGIVQGHFDDGEATFDPRGDVTRQQMASFVARALDQMLDRHHTMPVVDGTARFSDSGDIAAPHRDNVHRLHELGIVRGYADGTFRPREPIDRAQMASFMARAIEEVTGQTLPRTAAFDDVTGTHRASIEKLTAIGVVQGRTANSYGPDRPTSREQMSTFIARTLDYLAEQGSFMPMSYGEHTAGMHGLTDVEWGDHDGYERVTFTLAGDDGFAGWRVRYVDEAIQDGSGHVIDVDGDAIIEVVLVGMAMPPNLDFDTWDEAPLVVGGDQIVEVVDAHVFEGRHQLFVGTTDVLPFTVNRLADPQRIYLDVAAG